MILGLVAGRWLRRCAPKIPMKRLLTRRRNRHRRGTACCISRDLPGREAHLDSKLDVVQRWRLFPDPGRIQLDDRCERKHRKWAFPLVVVGMNSIAAYLIAHLFEDFVSSSLRIHLGMKPFQIFGQGVEPLVFGAIVLLTFWIMLFWMYRRKVFLRI